MSSCLKCGGTGFCLDGSICDCGIANERNMLYDVIPPAYRQSKFAAEFAASLNPSTYGEDLAAILKEVTTNGMLTRNYLISAPPNSGKTVFAYTLLGDLYKKGVHMPPFIDISEYKAICSKMDEASLTARFEYEQSPVCVFKIPPDASNTFANQLLAIIERRVRNGHGTIFLTSCNMNHLTALDNWGRLKELEGDGNFNSLKIMKYWR